MAEKRKISLVLADVDGTLVTEDKVLTKRAERRQCIAAAARDLRRAWPASDDRSRWWRECCDGRPSGGGRSFRYRRRRGDFRRQGLRRGDCGNSCERHCRGGPVMSTTVSVPDTTRDALKRAAAEAGRAVG
jgi:hypothetical protein